MRIEGGLVAVEKPGGVEKTDESVRQPITVDDREVDIGVEPSADLIKQGVEAEERIASRRFALQADAVGEDVVDSASDPSKVANLKSVHTGLGQISDDLLRLLVGGERIDDVGRNAQDGPDPVDAADDVEDERDLVSGLRRASPCLLTRYSWYRLAMPEYVASSPVRNW